MKIITDSYLNQFPLFSGVKMLLEQFDSVVIQQEVTNEELIAKKLYNNWIALALLANSELWTKADWDNFLVNMTLATMKKSLAESIAYALVAVGFKFDNPITPITELVNYDSASNTITVHAYTLDRPIMTKIEPILKECIKSLVLYHNPAIIINIDQITIISDRISINTYNYLNININKILDVEKYDRIISNRKLIGRSIISMYEGSSDRVSENVYLKYNYYIKPYLSNLDYSIEAFYEWTYLDEDSNTRVVDSAGIKDDGTGRPVVKFDTDTLTLWVLNSDLPIDYRYKYYRVKITIKITNTYTTAELIRTIDVVWYKNPIDTLKWQLPAEYETYSGGIGYDVEI